METLFSLSSKSCALPHPALAYKESNVSQIQPDELLSIFFLRNFALP